ncbi:hypothetical protein [[Flexibacter] sp. ATCC 35208]|uniref:hypothetical protein n=1 Tax=[Flexibacter] sp. ATCC 35208 TaxID=1936242 RepID=UPI0015C321A1|nr:hypothetical protein [[Flexibacter] sp. ATCC 35208]
MKTFIHVGFFNPSTDRRFVIQDSIVGITASDFTIDKTFLCIPIKVNNTTRSNI